MELYLQMAVTNTCVFSRVASTRAFLKARVSLCCKHSLAVFDKKVDAFYIPLQIVFVGGAYCLHVVCPFLRPGHFDFSIS